MIKMKNMTFGSPDESGEKGIYVKNQYHQIEFVVGTNGNAGIYSSTNNKWLIYMNPSGTGICNATASSAINDGNGNNINSNMFFQKNETWTINEWYGGGYITGSTKTIVFTIPLPKRKGTTSSVSITGGKISVRGINGTYLEDYLALTNSKVQVKFYRDGYMTIYLNNSTAYNTTNNTPVGIQIDNMTLRFS